PCPIYTLSLHDALPIFREVVPQVGRVPCTTIDNHALPVRNESSDRDGATWICSRVVVVRPGSPGNRDRRRDVHGVLDRVDRRPRSEEHTSELQSPYDLV